MHGLHQPIIEQPLWEEVQAALASKLFDSIGERMIASHASRGTRRYRYYVSSSLQHSGDAANTDGVRIPASEIEALVTNKLAELFDDPIGLMERVAGSPRAPAATMKAVTEAQTIAETLRGSDSAFIAKLVGRVVQRIDVAADVVTIILDGQRIAERLGIAVAQGAIAGRTVDASQVTGAASASSLQIAIPAKLKRSGWAMRLILPSGETASARVDDRLVKAIATAHQCWEKLVQDPGLGVSDLAKKHGLTESWITRTLRLAFLDPAIVEQVLIGKAPAHLTPETLRSPDAVPALWSAQRARHRIHITR